MSLQKKLTQLKIIKTLIIFSFILGCGPKQIDDQNYLQSKSTFEIQLDDMVEKSFFELFELVDITELKHSEDFFMANIYRLKIHQGEFFAFDASLKNLIRYDPQGNALNRIGKIGEGPHELTQIADFAIDKKGNIAIASGVSMKINKYSKEGKYLSSIKLNDQMDQITIADQTIFSSLTYFNNLNKNLGVYRNTGDTLKTFFPFEKGIFPVMLKNISGHLTTNSSGAVLFNESASSRIYEIDEDLRIKPKFHFISNNDLWPESNRHELNSYFEKLATGELSYLTRFYEESDSHLFFALNKKQVGMRKFIIDNRIGYFDKESQKTYLSKKEDFLIYLSGPLAVENDVFYLAISKSELIKIREEHPEWGKSLKIFNENNMALEEGDSPMILRFRIL